jgi:hypothetical protein
MAYKFLAISLTLLLFIGAFHVSANRFELSDIITNVKDEHGLALAGATVIIKELHKTGITDQHGEFVLHSIRNGKYRVMISFPGYVSYRTKIEVKEHLFTLMAELKLLPNRLDEILVITYGTGTRRLNTGDLATVNPAGFENQSLTYLLSDLERRLPGLVVTASESAELPQDQQLKESIIQRQVTTQLAEQSREILSIGTRNYDLPGATTSTSAYADSGTRWTFTSRPINDLDCEIHMTAMPQNASNGQGTKGVGEMAIPTSIRFVSNPLATLPDTIIQTRDMIKEGSAYNYGGKLDFKLIVHRRFKDVKFSLTGFILFREHLEGEGLKDGDMPFSVSIK